MRTKVRAERVASAMERVGLKTQTLHGDKEQKERVIALNQFKSGEVKVLIATDISARGVDIPNVDYVINYDLPEVAETYVHRVGRTGRGTNKGNAVSFCSIEEKPILAEIETYLTKPIDQLKLDKDDYQGVIDFSNDTSADIKSLMLEIEAIEQKKKKHKGKR